jgi:hypothetical protein
VVEVKIRWFADAEASASLCEWRYGGFPSGYPVGRWLLDMGRPRDAMLFACWDCREERQAGREEQSCQARRNLAARMGERGPLWSDADARRVTRWASWPHLPAGDGGRLCALPCEERMYVGKADCLRDRVWKNHSGRGAVMTGSAPRRNVAKHLGIATSADIKARRYEPNRSEVQAVRDWLDTCDIVWVEWETKAAAIALEDDLEAEPKPPLTKR